MQKTIRGTTFDTASAQLICAGRWPVLIWDDNRRVETTQLADRTIYRTAAGRYFYYDKWVTWGAPDEITPIPPSRARLMAGRMRLYAKQFKTQWTEIATI